MDIYGNIQPILKRNPENIVLHFGKNGTTRT